MLKKEQLIQEIRTGLSYLSLSASSGGKLNLTDSNIHSEDFVCTLLNILYDWSLVNANQDAANYPCIDLIDRHKRIGVQVTADNKSSKVNSTIECHYKE